MLLSRERTERSGLNLESNCFPLKAANLWHLMAFIVIDVVDVELMRNGFHHGMMDHGLRTNMPT